MKLDSVGETVASNKLKGLRRWRLVIGGTLALAVTVLLVVGAYSPATRAAEGDAVEYTFGPRVQEGEHTYDWYRKTHADEAAKRYGVDPKKVGDGMDTCHWWCGVDNPQFWRKMAVLSGKSYNVTNVHQDFLRLLHTTPRPQHWCKIALINNP